MTPSKEHKELLKLIAGENWHLDRVFSQLAKELAPVLARYKKFKGKSLWVGNEAVRKDIKRVLEAHNIRLTNHLEGQILKSWNLSHSHKDRLVSTYTAGMEIPEALNATMLYRNSKAIESHLKYGRGRSFSKRVWANTRQVDGHIKRFLKEGLSEGRSAAELTKDIKQYLKEPDKRFRRIRDRNGRLVLSSPAKSYKAGRGVYRSSYKNALRLTRNEINIGYRMADVERRAQIPFIVGVTVKLSPAHPKPDICDDLVGDYPSNYVHLGFHTSCLCYTVSKLLPKAAFKRYLETGKIPEKYKVKRIGEKRCRYVLKHRNKLEKSYFFQDNKKLWEVDVDNLIQKAKFSANEVDVLARRVAGKFGGYVTPINLKSKESILRKLGSDLGGDISQVKDAVRNTIIVPKGKVPECIAYLEKNVNFVRVKIQTPDRFMGYSGVLSNVKTSHNILGEIQVNTEKMIYAKEKPIDAMRIIGKKRWGEIKKETGLEGGLGHKYYEEYRETPKKEMQRRLKLERLSNDYYKNFR